MHHSPISKLCTCHRISDDNIEMGELAEERELMRGKKLQLWGEDLEEGEASNESSKLSDPPND